MKKSQNWFSILFTETNICKTACLRRPFGTFARQAVKMLNKRQNFFYAIATSIITWAISTLMNMESG